LKFLQFRNFKSNRGTRVINLRAPLSLPRFVQSPLQWVTNFEARSAAPTDAAPVPPEDAGSAHEADGNVTPLAAARLGKKE